MKVRRTWPLIVQVIFSLLGLAGFCVMVSGGRSEWQIPLVLLGLVMQMPLAFMLLGYRVGQKGRGVKSFFLWMGVAIGAMGLLLGGLLLYFHFVLYPGLKPMMSWDAAHVLSVRLAQVTSEDFRAVGLETPTAQVELSSEEARKLIDRLYATGRFPDWKPGDRLLDFDGKPYAFFFRPNDAEASPRGKTANVFIAGVTSPTVKMVIEN